jgi:hypothetical protein
MPSLQIHIPPFSHYVVLREMKASGLLYYRGQVIEPPEDWGHQVGVLCEAKYIAPVPGEISTIALQANGTTLHFVSQAFADMAAKVLLPEPESKPETEEPDPPPPKTRRTR